MDATGGGHKPLETRKLTFPDAGLYTRIGDLVHIEIEVVIINLNALVQDSTLTVANLPFQTANSQRSNLTCMVGRFDFGSDPASYVTFQTRPNKNSGFFQVSRSNALSVALAVSKANTEDARFRISGTYKTVT